jgi:hypothetical protein
MTLYRRSGVHEEFLATTVLGIPATDPATLYRRAGVQEEFLDTILLIS